MMLQNCVLQWLQHRSHNLLLHLKLLCSLQGIKLLHNYTHDKIIYVRKPSPLNTNKKLKGRSHTNLFVYQGKNAYDQSVLFAWYGCCLLISQIYNVQITLFGHHIFNQTAEHKEQSDLKICGYAFSVVAG